MKRTIERIVPLAPAVAAVGVSLCASSLLFTAPPQPVGPRPVSTPVTGQVGRVVASSVPIARPTSRRPVPTVRAAAPRTLAARARRAETPAAAPSQQPVRHDSPVGPSSTPPPPPSIPSPPPPPASPAPPASAPQASTSQATPAKGGSRPGWGRGDPNHDHTGPPGQRSKNKAGQDNPAPAPQPPPQPAPSPQPGPGNAHGNDHGGGKK